MKLNRKKTVCIFDFDGTLVDSMGSFGEIAASLLEQHYRLSISEGRQAYFRTSGLPFGEQLETLYPKDPRNEGVARAFEEQKQVGYFEQPFCENALETIHFLRQRGIKAVVSSNNHQELVEDFLKRRAVDLDLVLGWRPQFSKGAGHFQHIQEKFSVTPGEMLFVGDSLMDAERAVSCAIDFIGITGLFTAADFHKQFPQVTVIQNLAELKDLL